jgi:hypothetical protein
MGGKQTFGSDLMNGTWWTGVGWVVAKAANEWWPLIIFGCLFVVGFVLVHWDRWSRNLRTWFHLPPKRRKGRIVQTSEGRTTVKWRGNGGVWDTFARLPPASLLSHGRLTARHTHDGVESDEIDLTNPPEMPE